MIKISYKRLHNTFTTCRFGSDKLPILLNKVRCQTSDYLVILQCSYNTTISSSCTSSDDLSVTCCKSLYITAHVTTSSCYSDGYCFAFVDSQRIWDNPKAYNGQVRLTGGDTVNQGLVEVYCNGQWSTVCGDGFSPSGANTVCKQLGYSRAHSYNST